MLNENGKLGFPKTASAKDISNPPEENISTPVIENDSTTSLQQASVSFAVVDTQDSEVSILMNEFSQSEVDVEMEKSDSQLSQSTVASSISSSQALKYKTGELAFMIPGIPSMISTERKCCVCGSPGRKRIPFCAILDAYVKRRIHIPPNNRCCDHHLENGRFTETALLLMTPQKKNSYMTGREVAKWMDLMANHCIRSQKTLDFGGEKKYDDAVYQMMLGVKRDDFESLHTICKERLRNSKNR